MQFKDLKLEYDGKKIGEIEKEIEGNRNLSLAAEKKFIHALVYLERTNRFKENPRFKTSTFTEYIGARYAMPYQKYHLLRVAYDKFEPETDAHGVGMVTKAIISAGGVAGAEKVFGEVKKKESQSGKPISQSAVSDIIRKFEKPRIDYKKKVEVEKEEAVEAKQYMMAVMSDLDKAEDRIEKLAAAVAERDKKLMDAERALVEYGQIIAMKDKLIAELRERLEFYEKPIVKTESQGVPMHIAMM